MNNLLALGTPTRLMGLVENILANLIWSTSFILVKLGLPHMSPLTMAGLRYFLGFVVLLPLLARAGTRSTPISRSLWAKLFLAGVTAHTVGNGAFYWSLEYLPVITITFMQSLAPLPVLVLSIFWLREVPGVWQITGIIVSLVGSWLYFSAGIAPGEIQGFILAGVGLAGLTIFGVLGRELARDRQVNTSVLTAVPLGFGGGMLFVIALLVEGLPGFSPVGWSTVIILAVVNTVLAYMLYNHSLQVLTAVEATVLFNISTLGTITLSWFLLGERVTPTQMLGLLAVVAGLSLVQVRWKRRPRARAQTR
jgi:drug/metabolite transporter (DMT)-like permease